MARHVQTSPATRFKNIAIQHTIQSVTGISNVSFVNSAGAWYSYSLFNGFPASGTDERLDLFALKIIYESTDGFLNGDGDSVTPVVVDFPGGNTLEDLEAYGYPNPLKGNGPVNDYVKGRKYIGKTAMEATIAEDSTTGKITATARFDIKPKRRKPEGSFNHPLNDWYASEYDDDEWQFIFVFDAGVEHEDLDYYENPPLAAFLNKMEDIRTSGDTVTETDETNPILASTYTGRLFTTRFNGQSTDMVFRIFSVARRTYDVGSTTYISHAIVRCRRDPSSTTVIDASAINRWLSDTENVYGVLSTGDLEVEPTYIGAEDWPAKANGLVSASGALRILEPGIEFTRQNYRRFLLGPGHGLVTKHSELATYTGQPSRYLVPVHTPGVDVIHCDNTDDIQIYLNAPNDLLLWDMNHYTFEVHNTANDGLVKFLNPGLTEVFALALGESLTVRMVRQTAGKWEIRFLDIPVRRYERGSAETAAPFKHFGTLSNGGDYSGQFWFYINSLRHYLFPDMNADHIHEIDDISFDESGSFTGSGGYTTLGTHQFPETIKIKTAGRAHVEFYASIKANTSGHIDSGWGLILQKNDGFLEDTRTDKYQLDEPGNGASRIVHELDIEADDQLAPLFIYPPNSSTTPDHVQPAEKYFLIDLKPTLETIKA